MDTLLFRSPSDPPEHWDRALRRELPDLNVRCWPDHGNPADIDYALIWAAPDELLHELPNLRAVFSIGAGVDHLLDGAVPVGVPIVRMVDPALTEGMVEYVLYHVLRHHRGMPDYEARQARREWAVHAQVRPMDRRIGVLGLGALGGVCARCLADRGFDVAGFSRTRKQIPGVRTFAGPAEFDEFLAHGELLVCLLPLTTETRGLLARPVFERMPRGATLIHAARGQQLVEEDLLMALGQGWLRHAVLDVFPVEPLPPDHPFWVHPHVTVTPHIASLTNPDTGAARVAEGIRRDRAGETIPNTIDRSRGY